MMGKSLRDRAFVLRMEPLRVSTLRASIAFAALLVAGCESRVLGSCTKLATGETYDAERLNDLGGVFWVFHDANGIWQTVGRKNSSQFRCTRGQANDKA